MRRPSLTASQRKHAKEQRAVLSVMSESDESLAGTPSDLALAFADLAIACDRYADALTARERRKLARR